VRFVITPCSFKESLTANVAAQILSEVARKRGHDVDIAPLADGGEGTLDALREGFTIKTTIVKGMRGERVKARWGLAGKRALLEAAEVVGLAKIPRAERDPMRSSTFGIGELIHAALDAGANQIDVALGGTGTVDGGAGMMAALGARFLSAGDHLAPNPGALEHLTNVDLSDLDPRLKRITLRALVDVRSPLLGPRGARMYMAQKGATPPMQRRLERVLRKIHGDVRVEGAGAAGGLGAGILALGGTLTSGAEAVLALHDMKKRIARADVVLSGEGKLDAQTLEGKALAALGALCKRANKPLIVFCGAIDVDDRSLKRAGITAAFPIVSGPCSLDDALAHAKQNLRRTATNVIALL
jgi:glycerate 2-kinase